MNVIQITPGTGNFHCGSCMRDAALVLALRRLGHDVRCVPLYLPFVTEEDHVEDSPLFFGGINVYLQQKSRLFRSTPRWIDRVFDQSALLRWATRGDHMTTARELGELTISTLLGDDGNQVKELNRLAEWMVHEPKPDLISLSNVMLLGIGRKLKEVLRVPIVCTLQGEDSFLDALPDPLAGRAWDLLRDLARDVDAFIPVSRYYGDLMTRRLDLDPSSVHVVWNAMTFDGYTARAALPDPPVIGYLTRMCRVKGLEALVDAYILLRKRNRVPGLRLHVAGAETGADKAFVKGLEAKLRAAGVLDDVIFLPNISREEKIEFLRGLSVLSVPATYGESFGLYVIESLACGVPVVQPDHAAFPELIAATGGGVLVPPDNVEALADALADLVADTDKNLALGNAGREQVLKTFGMDRMAEEVMRVYVGCLSGTP